MLRKRIHWVSEKELFKTAAKTMQKVHIVLDIGCGIHPQNFLQVPVHICVEPYKEYLEYLQKTIGYEKKYIFLQMTWQQLIDSFPEKSVDTIFLIDVIEHLKKSEAQKLLIKTEKIARKQIIIFTPLGFVPQFHANGVDAWGMKGGSWQKHKSGWLPEDFDSTWEIYASKKFHTTNNKGVPFTKPFGAFWAIKTYNNSLHTKPLSRYFSDLVLHTLGRRNEFVLFLQKTKHAIATKNTKYE